MYSGKLERMELPEEARLLNDSAWYRIHKDDENLLQAIYQIFAACFEDDCKYAIRLKLLKAAARVVRSARYKYFKLCSSCPYKKEFYETLANIRKLQPCLC